MDVVYRKKRSTPLRVSSKLSSRRRYLRRPKVCKSSPNPGRCHPPPPPPPDWPPLTFDFHLDYWFWLDIEPVHNEWGGTATYDPMPGAYELRLPPPWEQTFVLTLAVPQTQFDIEISLEYDGFMPGELWRFAEPVIAPEPSFYTIDTWDDMIGFVDPSVLTFTF